LQEYIPISEVSAKDDFLHILEKIDAALAAARAAGRIDGRPQKLSPAQRADVVENVTSGRKSAAEIARLYRLSECR